MFTKWRFENLNIKTKKQLNHIETIKFRYRQEATSVCSYASLKFKIRYDSLHVPLLLKSKNKVFLRLHRDYSLFEKHNKKLFNQRCDSFLVKRRVDRLVYELDLSLRWKIHLVISITQLKLVSKDDDSYNRARSDYLDEVKVKDLSNTSWIKFYEIEKLVNRRVRQYDKIKITQYLLR